MNKKIEGSRILVTGGAGFVGSHLVDRLIEEGAAEVRVIDNLLRGSMKNLSKAVESGKLNFVEADIRDRETLDDMTDGADLCFHLAALRITRCAEDPSEALSVMLNGTFNIIDSCVKHKVGKLVFASSASVYGTADSFPTKEDQHPYNNHTFYGAAKMSAELMLRSFNDMYGLDYTALRFFNIYGPRMDREGKYTEVLIRWYYLIKEGKRPLIFGDGKQTMDFIYIDDVIDSYILAAEKDSNDEVFNIACGVETSLEELCFSLIKVMDSSLEPEYVPLPPERQKVEVSRRLADIKKGRKILAFSPHISLEDGLRSLVKWLDEVTE